MTETGLIMTTVLDEICDVKRRHVAMCKQAVSLTELETRINQAPPVRGFARHLQATAEADGYGLICEIKKASPSKGLIRADFDPPTLAISYENGGATCLSILTDAPYFQGADDYLVTARAACNRPALRKDFMVDPYQVIEARVLGADCILLIMAALTDAEAKSMSELATSLGMDVLVEVHDQPELDRALLLDTPLIGINNRNLKTLEVDIETTVRLAPHVPADRLLICESGLSDGPTLARMHAHGARAFLIGESLMRQNDVTMATRALLPETTLKAAV